MRTTQRLILSALVVCGGLGAGLAQAHGGDVQWSVTIGSGGVGVPVIVAPRIVHARPVVVAPRAPVVVHRAPPRPPGWHTVRWDRDRDGIPNWRDRRDNRRGHERRGPHGGHR